MADFTHRFIELNRIFSSESFWGVVNGVLASTGSGAAMLVVTGFLVIDVTCAIRALQRSSSHKATVGYRT